MFEGFRPRCLISEEERPLLRPHIAQGLPDAPFPSFGLGFVGKTVDFPFPLREKLFVFSLSFWLPLFALNALAPHLRVNIFIFLFSVGFLSAMDVGFSVGRVRYDLA